MKRVSPVISNAIWNWSKMSCMWIVNLNLVQNLKNSLMVVTIFDKRERKKVAEKYRKLILWEN